MPINNFAREVLEQTSRTFFTPIIRLPNELQEVVAASYLSLRAIDEIEDHSQLDKIDKVLLLNGISQKVQELSIGTTHDPFTELFKPYRDMLPSVTLSINDWLRFSPKSVAPRLWDTTAAMASRMAYWAKSNWKIDTQIDLDHYTFNVAGAVGLLLCDIWAWYDGTQTDRVHAIGFGRALQAVNILRNRQQDLRRGVDFFPDNWTRIDMQRYARANLKIAKKYIQALPNGAVRNFCTVPFSLAHATLNTIESGHEKLSREDVYEIIQNLDIE